VRYVLIPALWQISKHAANRAIRSFPLMRVCEALFSVKRRGEGEADISDIDRCRSGAVA